MEFAQTRTDGSAATGQAGDDLFAKVDADGSGSLSANGPQGAGGPPPGGPPPASASSADSTTYDPLDTNKDGVVSAAEATAGAATGTQNADTLQALLQAIDSDQDGKLSKTEADAFAKQVAPAVDTLQKSSTSTDSIDLNQLAQQVLKQYALVAAGQSSTSTGSTVSVSA